MHTKMNERDNRLVVTFIFAFFPFRSLELFPKGTGRRKGAIYLMREMKNKNGSIDETIERCEGGGGEEERSEFICVFGCSGICECKKCHSSIVLLEHC